LVEPLMERRVRVSDKVKVVFIAGSGRSGSTVVAQVLAEVPGWVTCGELRLGVPVLLQDRLCGCGARAQQCPFWQAVMEAAFGGFDIAILRRGAELMKRVALNRHTFLHFLPHGIGRFGREVREYASIVERIYQGMQAVSGCEVIVDTSKLPAYFLALGNASTLDLRTVHIVRDSRAVAFSNQRRVRDPANPDATRYMPQQGLALTSTAWNVKNAFITTAMAKQGGRIIVRYEDFVRRPTEEVERVLRFAGSDRSPPPITRGQLEIGTHHTTAGNPMRFQRGALHLRLDDEWQDKMKRRDRSFVTALTWPMLARYGYLREPRSAPRSGTVSNTAHG
jgi:hypothetical protein